MIGDFLASLTAWDWFCIFVAWGLVAVVVAPLVGRGIKAEPSEVPLDDLLADQPTEVWLTDELADRMFAEHIAIEGLS